MKSSLSWLKCMVAQKAVAEKTLRMISKKAELSLLMSAELKLDEQEIRLLLIAVDSCLWPVEIDRHPSVTTNSIAVRAKRKLNKMKEDA